MEDPLNPKKTNLDVAFYQLVHATDNFQTYGCLNPKCHFVYTEDEIKSDEFREFQENHLYSGTKVRPYKLESKTWKLEEIINASAFEGWTPAYTLTDNGFEFIAKIDLFEMYDDIRRPGWSHNLEEKKEEIARILYPTGYQSRELVIFRTSRYGLAVWDSIYVYAVGNYHSNKKKIHEELTRHYLNEQRREAEETKQRITQNKAGGIKLPTWEETKQAFEDFQKTNKARAFIFDPCSKKGYDVESVEEMKQFYQNTTNSTRKKRLRDSSK